MYDVLTFQKSRGARAHLRGGQRPPHLHPPEAVMNNNVHRALLQDSKERRETEERI